MKERTTPTHVLTIAVPLNLDGAFDYDPLREALNAIVPITKLAVDGVICDDLTVSVHEITILDPGVTP